MSGAISEESPGTASTIEPPTKQRKTVSQTQDDHVSETRTLKIKMLNGDEFEVSVPCSADVGDLEAEVAKQMQLGPCFTLMVDGGQPLNDISAPLPQEGELSCHIEDLSEIPSAAHKILGKVFKRGTEDPKKLQELRLGRCRTFGRFPGSEWKEGGIESAISDIEDEDDETYDMYGEYQVMEFTLIDGANKRLRFIAVINGGDADANTGMWGSVYLRPGLQSVAAIRSAGDTASEWNIDDDSMYTPPSEPLPASEGELFGGGEHVTTPFMAHLAHALEAANASTDENPDE